MLSGVIVRCSFAARVGLANARAPATQSKDVLTPQGSRERDHSKRIPAVQPLRACSGKRNTSKLPNLPALQGRLTKIAELSSGRGLTYLPSKAGKSRTLADYDVFLFPEQTLIHIYCQSIYLHRCIYATTIYEA